MRVTKMDDNKRIQYLALTILFGLFWIVPLALLITYNLHLDDINFVLVNYLTGFFGMWITFLVFGW